MPGKGADGVRLTWPRRGLHVLRDEATGSLSFAEAGLPPYRLVEEDSLGTEAGAPFNPSSSNLLVKGENLFALLGLMPDFRGKVDMVYVDPPFNTGSGFPDYFDDFDHDAYLSMMEVRLSLALDLLRPGGILAVHTDREEQPYIRVLLDELIGRERLLAQISWQRGPDRTLLGQGSTLINDCVEYIAVYSNGPVRRDLPVPVKEEPLSAKTLQSYARILEFSEERTLVEEFPTGRLGQIGAAIQPGDEPNMVRIYAHKSFTFKPVGVENVRRAAEGAWAKFPDVFPKMARLTNQQRESTFQQALIRRMPDKTVLYSVDYYQTKGKYKGPRRRYYLGGQVVLFLRDVARLDPRTGTAVRVADMNNFWTHDEVPSTGIAGEGGVVLKRGKKPEALLHRLIGSFTKEGELVLDFFAGSGTTGAVAHKMGRRWIMVDASDKSAELALRRMVGVVDGEDLSGISSLVGWKGGGGFRLWSVHAMKRQGPLPLPLEPENGA
ncbi:MAG: site-specific DNA-methyltransferase [Bacillota bacterium]